MTCQSTRHYLRSEKKYSRSVIQLTRLYVY
jgi:hypothetical protein